MSIDKSLRKRGSLARARNVLQRQERIEKLKELELWSEEQGPFNLPKTRVQKVVTKKAAPKKAAEEGAAEGQAAAGAAAPAAAAAAPAGKAAGKPAAKGGGGKK